MVFLLFIFLIVIIEVFISGEEPSGYFVFWFLLNKLLLLNIDYIVIISNFEGRYFLLDHLEGFNRFFYAW